MQTPQEKGSFESFNLHPDVMRGIVKTGFVEPRPIQAQTVPKALAGEDILGLAQTGTGKTAAFALPILHALATERKPGPRALILAPTRELVRQIETELRLLGKYTQLRSVAVYGGVSARSQVDVLRRNPDVILACPGRLVDLMQQGFVRLGRVETFVLDEADHMFDMGFAPDIKRILSELPAQRQNLLFSATMPQEIRSLADKILKNPHVVKLKDGAPPPTIQHSVYAVEEQDKFSLLQHLLGDGCDSAIVFSRTKHRAKRLAMNLSKRGVRTASLQGNMSQAQRDRAMEDFRRKRFDVLVATDIVARGIDVASVSHVFNYDVPNTPEIYTHRVGRTGRATQAGTAVTFATREDRSLIRAIERKMGFVIPRLKIERPADVARA